MKQQITLKREQLYKEVWKTPGSQLAKRYGISDVALAKICRKMDVPRPYRGYWRRLETGQSLKRTSLPRPKTTTVLSHQISRGASTARVTGKLSSKVRQVEFRKPIVVPDKLKNPHPLIRACKDELKWRDNFKYGWNPHHFSKDNVSILVHKKARARAFRIMDAFIKAIEARGHEVIISDSYYGGGCALIFGQEIRFDMRDRDWVREEDSEIGATSFGWSWEDKPIRIRRGLVFRVYKSWNSGCGKRTWSDGKRQRLENLLDPIFLEVLRLARIDRRHQIEMEHWERERKEKERVRRIEEERRIAEQRRRQDLIRATNRWRRSRELLEFIDAMDQRLRDETTGKKEILQWARTLAAEMDPLSAPSHELIDRFS